MINMYQMNKRSDQAIRIFDFGEKAIWTLFSNQVGVFIDLKC